MRNDKAIINSKITLYLQLLNTKVNDLIESDIELMSLLAKDSEIQELIVKKK